MPQPSDYGGFGTLFDRYSLRAGFGPAADGRCVLCHGIGEFFRKGSMPRSEIKKPEHRPAEVFYVLGVPQSPFWLASQIVEMKMWRASEHDVRAALSKRQRMSETFAWESPRMCSTAYRVGLVELQS